MVRMQVRSTLTLAVGRPIGVIMRRHSHYVGAAAMVRHLRELQGHPGRHRACWHFLLCCCWCRCSCQPQLACHHSCTNL